MAGTRDSLPFPVALDEEIVRRLCGAVTFTQADELQRAGHVFGASYRSDELFTSVRGIWRRIDQVAIPARAGKLYPTCTRHGPGYCRHVGALLLHWIRSSESFKVAAPSVAGSLESLSTPADQYVTWGSVSSEFLEAELADLLDAYTIDALRKLAQRRGFRAKGSKKLDVVSDVAAGLADRSGIDQALASLSAAERSTLDTIDLICAEHPVHDEAIQSAFKVLGGTGTPRPADLANLGLAVTVDGYYQSSPGYVVPFAVSARLPLLDYLAEPFQEVDEPPGASRDHALGIEEMLQVVALSVLAGNVGPPQPVSIERNISLPAGLIFGPDSGDQGQLLVALALIDGTSLEQLSSRTGQSGAFIDFVARLMVACDIFQPGPDLTLRKDRLQALLDLQPVDRRARMIDAWLKTAGPVELGYLLEQESQLRIYWHAIERSWSYPISFPVTSFIRLIIRLISRMTPDCWYSADSFTTTFTRLLPSAMPQLHQFRNQLSNHQNLRIVRIVSRSREQRLSLRNDDDWDYFVSGLVAAILHGPLQWLGLVDVHRSKMGSRDFRVLPAAGILAGREVPGDEPVSQRRAIVCDDMTVTVPAGTTDVSVHSLLSRIGELSGALPGGLSYRLTPSGFHSAFDAGMTGPDIVGLLVEQNCGALPTVAADAIDRWWQDYGSTRLYDEMCVIELSDDFAQAELMAATPLAASVVHVFSSRLMAIDPSHVDAVVAMLTDRGYAPRVIEED